MYHDIDLAGQAFDQCGSAKNFRFGAAFGQNSGVPVESYRLQGAFNPGERLRQIRSAECF